jgi:hypothetical protein
MNNNQDPRGFFGWLSVVADLVQVGGFVLVVVALLYALALRGNGVPTLLVILTMSALGIFIALVVAIVLYLRNK